jgi:hypothetical protein
MAEISSHGSYYRTYECGIGSCQTVDSVLNAQRLKPNFKLIEIGLLSLSYVRLLLVFKITSVFHQLSKWSLKKKSWTLLLPA